MDVASHFSPKWWKSRREGEPDAQVVRWKEIWLEGATAAWTPGHNKRNPHPTGQEQAAWDAGFRWGEANPDRRGSGGVRLAHPHRRASDAKLTTSLKTAAAFGATGVALYAFSRALKRWRNPS